ncbi:MAG: hypothetical protein Q8P18_26370 [Pseudomonadota bacterium]|nr:hypothetical protein [Pseudomonadota bacterium]
MFEIVAATPRGWSAGLFHPGAWAESTSRVAIASTGTLLYWAGRAHYDGHRRRYRVIVYDRARRRVAVLDDLRWPVRDLAFDPEGRRLAIGTGAYDGGYAYEGELVVWALDTGVVSRPFAPNREVRRVRWQGDELLALLAPETDETDETFGLRVPSLRVEPATESALGFEPLRTCPWATEGAVPFLDVALFGERVAAAGDGALVTTWDAELRDERRVSGPPGRQLLGVGAGLVHACDRVSSLHTLDGAPIRVFDRAYLMSTDGTNILARDTSYAGDRADLVLDARGNTLHASNLGHFDCFNHSLRLDGGLWFLRGTPASQHQAKVLAHVDSVGPATVAMQWDTSQSHHMESTAVALDGGSIVAGYRVHHPHPGKGDRYLERRSPTGASVWRTRWPFAPVALAHVADWGVVIAATLDGRLAALDARTGVVAAATSLRVDGLDVVPTCLAVSGSRIAVGTTDGRVLIVEVG